MRRTSHGGVAFVGQISELLRLRHGDDVADAELFEQAAERPVLAVGLVRGHPRGRQACGQAAGHDRAGEFALGREPPVVGDLRRPASLAVLRPGLGQVELAVDQRASAFGGVGGETPIWQLSIFPGACS